MEITFVNDEYSDNLEDALAFARKHHLKYLELRQINGKSMVDLSEEEASVYAAKIAEAGILTASIASPFLYWDMKESKFNIMRQALDSEEEYFIKLMDLADIFGAQYISIYSYYANEISVDDLGKRLDKYSQMAMERGIVLLLNMDKKCNISNIHSTHQLFENYNFSNIYPLIDTGKIIADADEYNPQELQDVLNTCNYFHVSDYDVELKRYVVFGEGNVDFETFLGGKKQDNNIFLSLDTSTNHREDMVMSLNQLEAWWED